MKNLPVLTREITNLIKNNIYYWDLVLKTCQGSSETVYLVFEINMANVEVAAVAYCIRMYMYKSLTEFSVVRIIPTIPY